MILLDWKMPGMTGIEVLRELRKLKVESPVVFLTVLSDQIYEEAGLLGGAVDFIEKSRSFSNSVSPHRTDPQGREGRRDVRKPQPQAVTLNHGDARCNATSSGPSGRITQIELTLTEFRIFEYLVTRAGHDVRYRELYDIVHGEGFAAGSGEIGFRANVRAFIKRIRQKFRDVDPEFAQIENYPGFGYRWRAAMAVSFPAGFETSTARSRSKSFSLPSSSCPFPSSSTTFSRLPTRNRPTASAYGGGKGQRWSPRCSAASGEFPGRIAGGLQRALDALSGGHEHKVLVRPVQTAHGGFRTLPPRPLCPRNTWRRNAPSSLGWGCWTSLRRLRAKRIRTPGSRTQRASRNFSPP